MNSGNESSLVEDLANAPGTLPALMVEERFRAQARQFRHDNTIEPLAPTPSDRVTVTATSGSEMQLETATVFFTIDGSRPDAGASSVPMSVAAIDWDVRTGYLARWRAELPLQPDGTVVRYRIGGYLVGASRKQSDAPDIWAHDGQGFWFRDQGDTGIDTFAYLVECAHAPLPAWMETAVIYQIFLDRFDPGNDDGVYPGSPGAREIHGGNLHGVRRRLQYLSALGVNCLWLSPIHPAETYHRYDTMDFFDVDPRLGQVEDLRLLVADAHDRGIRVILDFVPSHLSWRHPAFLQARADFAAPSSSWFTFYEWPHTYRSFLNSSEYLPSIDTRDSGARQHLIDSAVFWVKDVGVDGFRLDHAIGPGMDFWVAFKAAVQAARPDVVTIGEATDTPDSLKRFHGKIHGVLDFELAASLRLTVGKRGWDVGHLENQIASYDRFMADGPGRVSFLDNHDMDRFLWVAGNDASRLKLAALCQFTLSPTPTVYYGTEIGMTQSAGAHDSGSDGDAEARRDMIWHEDQWDLDLLAFYRALIHTRSAHPVLASGRRQLVALEVDAAIWGYVRCAHEDMQQAGDLLIILHLGEGEIEVALPGVVLPVQSEPLVAVGYTQLTSDGVRLGPWSGGLFALG